MLGYQGKVTRRLAAAAVGGVLLLAFAGCAREDQNALVVFGTDSVVTVAPLSIPATGTEPGGTAVANLLELVSFDPAALDAFGRQSQIFSGLRYPEGYPYWRSSGYWYVSSTSSSSTAQIGYPGNDPRLPALTGMTGGVCGTPPDCFDYNWQYMAIADAFGSTGGEWWDVYGAFCCLAANTRYILTFERLGLTVNGELDAVQLLLGQTVDQPDELYWLGGSPAGDHTRPTNLFNTGDPYPMVANANPYIVGYLDTDASGDVYLDAVVGSRDATGAPVWMLSPDPVQSTSPFAPNDPSRHTFPNYNYWTVYEANPDGTPNYNRPAVRYQWGVDLSDLGGPINNAYAPFPRAALSDPELALGKGAVSRPDSVTFALGNLKELAGTSAYYVWSVDDTGAFTQLDFLYTPPGGTEAAATSFNGGDGTHTIMLEYPDDATNIVYSIETGVPTGTPGAAQIIWAPGLQEAGESKSNSLPVQFGSFSESRTWAISGNGSGGLLGSGLRYLYEQLPRPPVGYKYVGWLASGDTLFTRLADETFTSPPPEFADLSDADTDLDLSDVVQTTMILRSITSFCVSETDTSCFDLGDYDTFFLALEPKAGVMTDPSATRVLSGVTPVK